MEKFNFKNYGQNFKDFGMIESFKDVWDCVERVNAHLVVEN